VTKFENWGDYFWPGQIDDCRINLLGIHDAEQLETQERRLTALRAAEIASGEAHIPRTFDLAHLQAIHRHLFQDVYEWAGELRATELVRPAADPNQPPNEFVKPEDVERLAGTVFGQLGDPAELRGRPQAEVVDALARTYAAVNVLHPFVEGNGRAQRIFLDHVAEAAGYRIEWNRIADRQNAMMAEAFGVGSEPVRQALADCVVPADLDRQAANAAWHAGGGVADPSLETESGSAEQAGTAEAGRSPSDRTRTTRREPPDRGGRAD
jgi:fido (protein-threonine AMPylation protein)